MKPETLQEAVWLLLCGERGREKRIAAALGVDASTVSGWAHGDVPVRLETIAAIEDVLHLYVVTEYLHERREKCTV